MNRIKDIVTEYRNKDITGSVINLSPLNDSDLANVVRMRNHPKMMYYFNQAQKITLDSQIDWYMKYIQRDDDLYWVIKDKSGHVIGTNRLYAITQERCEQGSLMIDYTYAMGAPYAAEAILLSLNFAFDKLGVHIVVNENRHDNKNMNSITKRFGFKFIRENNIRGIIYNYYELYPENYKKNDIEELIQLWMSR